MTTDMDKVISEFKAFLESKVPPHGNLTIEADGELHRYCVEGDRTSSKNGAYCLHTDGRPAGYVMSWKTDEKYTWRYELTDDEKKTYAQRQSDPVLKAQTEKERLEREQRRAEALRQQRAKQERARMKALSEYNHSRPFCNETGLIENPYWCKKFETLHVMYIDYLRLNLSSNDFPVAIVRSPIEGGFCERGSILVPMVNLATGEFQSLIKIAGQTDSDGVYSKKNYPESTIRGAGHWVIAPDSAQSQIILVSEGITTAIAVAVMNHQQGRRDAVLAVGDCGNLKPACEVLQGRYQGWKVIIFADNDRLTKQGRNPGLDAARECEKLGLADRVEPSPVDGEDWYDVCFEQYKLIEERIEVNG